MYTMVIRLIRTTIGSEVDFSRIVATLDKDSGHDYEYLKDHVKLLNVSALPNEYYKIDYEVT
jgi:hypothetical protein